MSRWFSSAVICSAMAFGIVCSRGETPESGAAPTSTLEQKSLPERVYSVMLKFDQFERSSPTRSSWEAKRRDVLRFLRSSFEQETAKANLEGSIAIREVVRVLTERSYEDVRLRNALADIQLGQF